MNADGSITEAGTRRVVAVADIRVFTPLCLAPPPDATVSLEVKKCPWIGPCGWETLAEASYADLPTNGRRVSDVISATARKGTHSYRVHVHVKGLKGAKAGLPTFQGRGDEHWFSQKDVKLEG